MTEFDPNLLHNIMAELTPQAPVAPKPFEEAQPVQKQETERSYYGMDAVEMAEFLLNNLDQLPVEDYETLLAVMDGQPYKLGDLERMIDSYFKPSEQQPQPEAKPPKDEDDDEDEGFLHYLAPMPASPVVRREPQVTALPPSTGVGVGAWWRRKKR